MRAGSGVADAIAASEAAAADGVVGSAAVCLPMRFCEVAELLAYCLEREALEEGGPLHFPVEVVEVLSHLGIYHHNFEHYRHGLVLLQLAEGLIAALDARAAGGGGLGVGGSAAQVNSARTHVMFYLAQVRVILVWPCLLSQGCC